VANFLDYQPLFPEESEEAILQRWIEWANEGLSDTDPTRVDTREGGMWRTLETTAIQECARLYDLAGAEVPASANPLSAWGGYLDDIAEEFGVERLAATNAVGHEVFTGPEGTQIASGLRLESAGSAGTEPLLFVVTEGGEIGASGSLELPIEAVEPGAAGNVGANAITAATTALPEGTTINNPDALTGGQDIETDEHLSKKILELFEGRSAGTQLDYVIQTRKWLRENDASRAPGGGTVSCIPVWNGAGTVKIVAMDDDGNPLEEAVLEALQEWWDPGKTGRGEGQAPVSAVVTVATGTVLQLTIVGAITFRPGYSLTGFGGTIALQGQIERALALYALGVEAGGEVVISQIEGAIVTVPGVEDLSGLEVNGKTTNLALGSEPPEVPRLHRLELTE
jgi:uncharacterized phage protein gp47/JayE